MSEDDKKTMPIDQPDDGGSSRPESNRGGEYEDATLHGSPGDSDKTVVGPEAQRTPKIPARIIGSYHLLKELGAGGQGAVYLAEDKKLKRKVALKVLSGASFSAQARMRFEREAETTGRLNHPGIARIFELGEDEGVLFIAMELVEGETLETRIRESKDLATQDNSIGELQTSSSHSPSKKSKSGSSSGSRSDPRPFLSAVRFMEDTALALHMAHESGLVHRDIKPANIMMRPDGSSCILDFGLVHDEESQEMTLTQSGDVFGTPAYMAPEQVQGQTNRIDARTDVWALGVALYECCTLVRPFNKSTRHELFQSIVQDEPTPPSRINNKIPKDLEAIILTAIDKEPERRYASALEFAEDLRRLLQYEAIHARPAGTWVKTVRWVQRNKMAASLGSLVVVALLFALGVFYVKNDEAQTNLGVAEKALVAGKTEREAKETALSEKTLALANYDRLADVKVLAKAQAASDLLYPPSPELVDNLLAWQEKHGVIASRLAGHKKFLTALRAQALSYSDEDRKRDFAGEITALEKNKEDLKKTEIDLSWDSDGDAKKKLIAGKKALEEQAQELTKTIAGRRSWDFGDDDALLLQHDIISDLVTKLERFATDEQGPIKSIAQRLKTSREIKAKTLKDHQEAWAKCAARIKENDLYDSLILKPQLGLIPLGPDPDSDLEEFLHFLTHKGAVPKRNEDELIPMTEDMGVVLVLIPGGTFLMGSQKSDPKKPNFDPGSHDDEGPVHEVVLKPYFLSKYEMTQAQWQRSFAHNPSRYGDGAFADDKRFKAGINLRHPVEQVSWLDVQKYLARIDLILPTEAEWECGARAGQTDQVYAGTSKIEELKAVANINGSETKIIGFTNQQPGHTDSHLLHAPVGSYQANAFGLHDMTGNVWEWCFDGFFGYDVKAGDRGIRGNSGSSAHRVYRGGSFDNEAAHSRVANRPSASPESRNNYLGVRPSRIVAF